MATKDRVLHSIENMRTWLTCIAALAKEGSDVTTDVVYAQRALEQARSLDEDMSTLKSMLYDWEHDALAAAAEAQPPILVLLTAFQMNVLRALIKDNFALPAEPINTAFLTGHDLVSLSDVQHTDGGVLLEFRLRLEDVSTYIDLGPNQCRLRIPEVQKRTSRGRTFDVHLRENPQKPYEWNALELDRMSNPLCYSPVPKTALRRIVDIMQKLLSVTPDAEVVRVAALEALAKRSQ